MREKNSSSEGAASDERYWNVGIVALTLASALYVVSRTVADPDLWGHVLFGLDILLSKSLPTTDSYSYLSGGHPWTNHELLSEVSFGLAYRIGGTPVLVLLKVAIAMTIVGLIYRRLVREGLDPLRAGILVIAVTLPMTVGLSSIRPQLFTYLFFLLTLLLLTADETRRRAVWLIPLLCAVWINFHGGVLAGIGIVGVWVAAAGLSRLLPGSPRAPESIPPGTALGVLVLSAAATLINPYGWRLPAFLLETATLPRPDISEWHALRLVSPEGATYLALLFIGIWALTRSERPRRPTHLAALACTALLPAVAIRHLPLFAIALPVLAGGHFASAWGRGSGVARGPRRTAAVAGCAVLAAVLTLASGPRFACIAIDPAKAIGVPAQAIGLLRATGAEGNMAVHFDYGEYAIWFLAPRVKVSMDGRRETVYPDSIYAAALHFQNGTGPWDEVLDKYPTDLALVPRRGSTYNLLSLKPQWQLLHEDRLVGMFARSSWPGSEALLGGNPPAIPADGAGRCFP